VFALLRTRYTIDENPCQRFLRKVSLASITYLAISEDRPVIPGKYAANKKLYNDIENH